MRGGTGDLQLRMPDGALTWFSGAHCRPWVAEDGLLPAGLKAGMPPPLAPAAPELLPHPPSPVPPLRSTSPVPGAVSSAATFAESPTTLAAPTVVAEPTTEVEFEAARLERQLKHEQMRAHLRWLVASDVRFKNQGALADELQFARPWLTQYMTGKSQHGVLRSLRRHPGRRQGSLRRGRWTAVTRRPQPLPQPSSREQQPSPSPSPSPSPRARESELAFSQSCHELMTHVYLECASRCRCVHRCIIQC